MTQQNISQSLRIDELAHVSGLPNRTIRFYNTQGLLPAPMMQGRVAYYNQEHLSVLNIIKEFKEQNLPLDVIRHLLEIRAEHGDIQMNLALKQRMLRPLTGGSSALSLTKAELMQQSGATEAQIDQLTRQELLFPIEQDGEVRFTGNDLLLIRLYHRLEQLGLPLALPALIRFQMRQLVRSELAAFEQHLLPQWHEKGLSSEQQAEEFEEMLNLTDTLISVLHRTLLYQL